MSTITPQKININLRTLPIGQKGFGMPLVLCGKAIQYFVNILTGNAGIRWMARTGGVTFIRVVYVVSGNNTALSVARSGAGSESDPYIITVTVATNGSGVPTSTAAQIKAAAEVAANVAGGSGVVNLSFLGDGTGVVSAVSSQTLGYTRYAEISEITDLSDLQVLSSDPEYALVNALLSQEVRPSKVALYFVVDWAQIANELASLINSGKNAWYKVLATTRNTSHLQAVANAIAPLKKLFFGGSDSAGLLSGRNGDREVFLIHKETTKYPEAAWVGLMAPKLAGSATYAYKRLSGQGVSGFSQSESASILKESPNSDGFGNIIADYSGVPVTWEGKTTSGQYIDVVVAKDFIEARLLEGLASMNINTDKVPYTLQGLSMYEAKMTEVFNQAGDQNILGPIETEEDRKAFGAEKRFKFKIFLPESIESIPQNDRANRVIPSIRAQLVLGGAIHKATIDIDITV